MRGFDNRRGDTMVAILVGLGIFAFLITAIIKLSDGALSVQRQVQNVSDFDSIAGAINHIVQKKSLCDVAFKNQSGAAAKFSSTVTYSAAERLSEIRIGTKSLLKVGDKLGSLTISKIYFEAFAAPSGVGSGKLSYDAALYLEGMKKGGGVITNRGTPVLLSFTTSESTGGFMNCSGAGGSEKFLGSQAIFDSVPSSTVVTVPNGTQRVQVKMYGQPTSLNDWTSEDSVTIDAEIDLENATWTGLRSVTGGNGHDQTQAIVWNNAPLNTPITPDSPSDIATNAYQAAFVGTYPSANYNSATRELTLSNLSPLALGGQSSSMFRFFGP